MVKKVCVLGAGTMGAGIAQVTAENGIETIIRDMEDSFVQKGLTTITNFIARKLEKGKIRQDQYDQTLALLKGTTNVHEAVEGVDMVIEAVPEDLALKVKTFAELDQICPPKVILATNTSTLSISKIAFEVIHKDRVVGTHFFSPVPLMSLVEIIKGSQTAEAVIDTAREFCKQIGKTSIIAKDIPGFIVNRFMCLLYNEAADQIYNGMASAEDIDLGMKLGANHPMGPVAIMDMAGVDVVYNALNALYQMTGEERYRPSPIFQNMIQENRLGRKTGLGFYDYKK